MGRGGGVSGSKSLQSAMALYGGHFMVIVDTTVWVDYLREVENPETAWLDRELTRQRLGLTEQILSEVLLGIRDGGEFGRVRDELLKFAVFRSEEHTSELQSRP